MGSGLEIGWKGESFIRSEDVMLMTALCVPRYPKSIPAVAAWLDSLLASPTGIIQAFPSSDLYKVSPSYIQAAAGLDVYSNLDLSTPIPACLL